MIRPDCLIWTRNTCFSLLSATIPTRINNINLNRWPITVYSTDYHPKPEVILWILVIRSVTLPGNSTSTFLIIKQPLNKELIGEGEVRSALLLPHVLFFTIPKEVYRVPTKPGFTLSLLVNRSQGSFPYGGGPGYNVIYNQPDVGSISNPTTITGNLVIEPGDPVKWHYTSPRTSYHYRGLIRARVSRHGLYPLPTTPMLRYHRFTQFYLRSGEISIRFASQENAVKKVVAIADYRSIKTKWFCSPVRPYIDICGIGCLSVAHAIPKQWLRATFFIPQTAPFHHHI